MEIKYTSLLLPPLVASSLILSACNGSEASTSRATQNITTNADESVTKTSLEEIANNSNVENPILLSSIDPAPEIIDGQFNIESKNTAPTANAGVDKSIVSGNPVKLDASDSHDPDNDELTYSWEVISLPTNSIIQLSSLSTAISSFTPDVPGTYVFSVTISDGNFSTSDSVTVRASEISTETAGVLCDFSQNILNESESVNAASKVNWSCTDNKRVLRSNGLPDHTAGKFPNAFSQSPILAHSVLKNFPLTPTIDKAHTSLIIFDNMIGYMLNGIAINNHSAGSCVDSAHSLDQCSSNDNIGNWDIEALRLSIPTKSFDLGLDINNAHTGPSGKYHYHGVPKGLVELQGGDSSRMTMIGWAIDGFPIYTNVGHSIPTDANSSLQKMTSSYQLTESLTDARPSSKTFPIGTFTQDWIYVQASGSLDECNGRFGVTPEFPGGVYHYFTTDTFPYLPRCIKGIISTDNTTPSLAPPPPPS